MANDDWKRSQQQVQVVLEQLPTTDESVRGGRLGNWYLVAEYEFDDHASLVRLHGTGEVKQTGWRSLGLLSYALEAERQNNFEYTGDDD